MTVFNTFERFDISLPPVRIPTNENDDERNCSLTSILTFGGIKHDVDCKSRKYDKQFHLHVNGLGEFTFDETGENMVYSTIDYDSKLLKKLHNIVEVWERRFHYF